MPPLLMLNCSQIPDIGPVLHSSAAPTEPSIHRQATVETSSPGSFHIAGTGDGRHW